MKIYSLKYRQIIKKDINTVFSFFSNPENLERITPKKLDFKILTPIPIKMKEGQLIEYTIRVLGKKIRWTTLITEYTPNKMFIDQQLSGPYSMWHHKHEFNIIDGSVEVVDTINYIVPFGFIGKVVNFLFIKNDLNKIFTYRCKIIDEFFKGEKNK